MGIAFLLVVALNRSLRSNGAYEGRAEPDLLQYLDLVALGTVCDVMPLLGVNRAFVTQGLKILAQRKNIDLKALGDLLEQIPGEIGSVAGDGAYDTTSRYQAISERDAKPIIPP